MINALNLSSEVKKAIDDWDKNLREAYSLLTFDFDKNKLRKFQCMKKEVFFNEKKITKIIEKTILDLSLISLRYEIGKNGINKDKVSACFIYHFINELPLEKASKACNLDACLKILQNIEDKNNKICLGQNIDQELKSFIMDRLTTPENLYFILKNLK